MSRVGVSASSRLAAEAAAEIVQKGGNAVDAAVAAALVSLTTDVGFVSTGASGFLAIWPPEGEPTLIDAYADVPGRGFVGPRPRLHRRARVDGTTTFVGYESVATPGAFAGLALACARHGRFSWKELMQPAIRWALKGFPLSKSAEEYYDQTGESIFGWHPETRSALRHASGRRVRAGDRLVLPDLGESLRKLGEEGVGCLYGGDLGRTISADVLANGGCLTLRDLEAYEAEERSPLRIEVGEWELAINPPPAVGGVTLAAVLLSLEERPPRSWSPAETRRLAEILRSVLEYRRDRLSGGEDFQSAARELLESSGVEHPARIGHSPSTVQTSAVDDAGTACSITLSDGYGSGVMVPTTGMWLNNALGETELSSPDARLPAPGTRMVSNMAPTVARRSDGSVLAIGSPGAGRIPGSIAQVLVDLVHMGMTPEEAVKLPRLHVDVSEDEPVLVHESGLKVERPPDWRRRVLPDRNLYFGGVQVAAWNPRTGFSGAADPRRTAVYTCAGDQK